MIKNPQLVFIPSPWTGHLVSTIKFSKLLLDRDNRFSVAKFLVMTPPFAPDIDICAKSLPADDSRNRIITLPQVIPPSSGVLLKSPENYISVFIEGHKPHVKNSIENLVTADDVAPLAGLGVAMFCTSMVDVANELGLPSYLFFTCNAAFLGLMLYLLPWNDIARTEFKETDPDSIIPTYVHPVPSKVMPLVLFNEHGGYLSMQNHGRRFKETKVKIICQYTAPFAHPGSGSYTWAWAWADYQRSHLSISWSSPDIALNNSPWRENLSNNGFHFLSLLEGPNWNRASKISFFLDLYFGPTNQHSSEKDSDEWLGLQKMYYPSLLLTGASFSCWMRRIMKWLSYRMNLL